MTPECCSCGLESHSWLLFNSAVLISGVERYTGLEDAYEWQRVKGLETFGHALFQSIRSSFWWKNWKRRDIRVRIEVTRSIFEYNSRALLFCKLLGSSIVVRIFRPHIKCRTGGSFQKVCSVLIKDGCIWLKHMATQPAHINQHLINWLLMFCVRFWFIVYWLKRKRFLLVLPDQDAHLHWIISKTGDKV